MPNFNGNNRRVASRAASTRKHHINFGDNFHFAKR
jgi:hypothetical protein